MLLDGIACRYKDLRSGKRQISEIHVAGDFVDLHSYTLKRLDHNIMSLTRCEVTMVPHERIQEIVEAFPNLAWVYWFATTLDAAIHREWELSLGQRSGVARLAHFFCELHTRLEVVGLAQGPSFPLAISQSELGECIGLTVVHTNRCLKELRERGLVTFQQGVVAISDAEGLKQLGEFDPAYLYLGSRSFEERSYRPRHT
jgi:CRP-like cAMP-binding protein